MPCCWRRSAILTSDRAMVGADAGGAGSSGRETVGSAQPPNGEVRNDGLLFFGVPPQRHPPRSPAAAVLHGGRMLAPVISRPANRLPRLLADRTRPLRHSRAGRSAGSDTRLVGSTPSL
jgi:hypothetical protein